MGCSCAPSPALMMLELRRSARNCGAPDELCRRTIISAWFASRIFAVSLRVSPFVRLEELAEILMTSALRRIAAISKDVRVRVLGSTKKFTSVLPRNAGTFLISRVPTSLKASAVSRMKVISSAESSRMPSRSFRCQRIPDLDCSVMLFLPSRARRRPVLHPHSRDASARAPQQPWGDFFQHNPPEWVIRGGHDL